VWNNARFLNWIANALTVIALTAFLLGAAYWLVHRPVFGLTQVVVEPIPGAELQRVSEASLRTALAGRLAGNFFTVDLEQVRQRFTEVPWVSQVMVRREWPHGLRVHVREYQPLGLWNDNQVLDVKGTPFIANQAEAEGPEGQLLPAFAGPEGSGPLVRQRYLELRDWLQPLGRLPMRLTLSARHAWQVELDNGLLLDLGRDPGIDWNVGDPDRPEIDAVPVATRVRRFVASLPELEQQFGRPIVHADLRYPDGFAVRLGPAPESRPSSQSRTTKP